MTKRRKNPRRRAAGRDLVASGEMEQALRLQTETEAEQPRRSPSRLEVDRNSPAQKTFERLAREAGMDPSDPWVGAYADYEWEHLRRILDAYGLNVSGADILEVGCNVGGSSVVLAALGGRVTAIDIWRDAVSIAQANLMRHGLAGDASVRHVPDTRKLPFASACFDLIVANSVLEYVATEHLDAVIAELHRVLRPGGKMLICGTASRIAPREVHSRRWMINYLPRALDRLWGKSLQRGLSPFHLRKCLAGRFSDIGASRWLAVRKAVHGRPSMPMRVLDGFGALFGCGAGWMAPNMELCLERVA